MARPQEFDRDQVLDAAIAVFRQHGFEGSSATALVTAMGIGRQSLYNSFGDKWQLYRDAMHRYATGEVEAHLAALRSGVRAIDGIQRFLQRVVETAQEMCLGVSSICEFGTSHADLLDIHERFGKVLNAALCERIRRAQADGDVSPDMKPDDAAAFLMSTIAGIRVSARAGTDPKILAAVARTALRGIR
ncbi:TetR/AcrR family transcriptional regulator [Gluconacetobacter tumulisoli]|uniref:TetR/AcrR family transcriptional regulator n=1 Tax=Gluconacetobacter tumulisoli TaxID=1286189 RepID=A0A7W4PNF5_9PROT|nr:TetR/AcrR family transcriptional regulator [Gluconacetobacter tumulisoli]MBB2200816.1 TetR/AcrR family transcriptional regulator [Gluconacetobacter tumulisoli]